MKQIYVSRTFTTRQQRQRAVSLLPYIAVLVGLHYLRSAWTAMIFYQAGMAATLLHQHFDWRVLWRGWHGRDGLLLSVLTGSSGILLVLCQDIWLTDRASFQHLLQQVGLMSDHLPLFILCFSILTPVLEEAFWRGALGSTSTQLAHSDLLFAGYHILVLAAFTSVPIAVVSGSGLAIMAWLWRRQYMRHQGLAVPVASHFGADLSIMLAVQYLWLYT
ncbi:MAG: CPBP family intramembrane metalloprotease [Caldilineaceae bacterium]|nr:CPBP family intramembrane metalloprotease [Caldilineaceae bacterium]